MAGSWRKSVLLLRRYTPSWSKLDTLARSPVLRSSWIWLLIVPVAAGLLASVPDGVKVNLGGNEMQLKLGLPFSWRLFYISAIAFTLAKVFFVMRCPKLVRDYLDIDSFVKSKRGFTYLKTHLRVVASEDNPAATIFRSREVEETGSVIFAEFSMRHQKAKAAASGYVEHSETRKIDVEYATGQAVRQAELDGAFWLVHDVSDNSMFCSRVVTFALYVMGFAGSTWVLLQGFGKVFGLNCR